MAGTLLLVVQVYLELPWPWFAASFALLLGGLAVAGSGPKDGPPG